MNDLVLPNGLGIAVAGLAREAGRALVETGGFILRPYDTACASTLAVAGAAGITRRRGLFAITPLALGELFEFADEHELTVTAQWHSHRFEAFLSRTDLAHGFDVPGFHTAVVPYFEVASADPADWGWWQYGEQGWTESIAPQSVEGDVSLVTFDEDGVS